MGQMMNSSVPMRPPENKHCVVISGKMFSGKSTFTQMFIDYMNPILFKRQPIAQDMKQAVHKYYGYTDVEAESLKHLFRNDYQHFGTETIKKNYKQDFHTVTALRNLHPYLLFDDARYPDELETIKANSKLFISIRMEATEETRKKRCEYLYGAAHWEKQNHNHTSETALDNYDQFDYTIYNSSHDEGFLDKVARSTAKEIFDKYFQD